MGQRQGSAWACHKVADFTLINCHSVQNTSWCGGEISCSRRQYKFVSNQPAGNLVPDVALGKENLV